MVLDSVTSAPQCIRLHRAFHGERAGTCDRDGWRVGGKVQLVEDFFKIDILPLSRCADVLCKSMTCPLGAVVRRRRKRAHDQSVSVYVRGLLKFLFTLENYYVHRYCSNCTYTYYCAACKAAVRSAYGPFILNPSKSWQILSVARKGGSSR